MSWFKVLGRVGRGTRAVRCVQFRSFSSGTPSGPGESGRFEDTAYYGPKGTSRSATGNIWQVQQVMDNLLQQNQTWAAATEVEAPSFFKGLAETHAPKYLWIGCSDARVPADKLLGEAAGQVFVHRNIANMVVATDCNLMSVLQYAVTVLKVKHVIVCGHYECGGVKAAMQQNDHASPLEDWLRNIRDVYRLHNEELDAIEDTKGRYRRLTELNVVEQTLNLYKTGVIQRMRMSTAQDPAEEFPTPQIHAMIYDPGEGILKELDVNWDDYFKELKHIFTMYKASGKFPVPPADKGLLRDCLEDVLSCPVTVQEMQGVFNKYASEEGTMDAQGFKSFVGEELELAGTDAELAESMEILKGGEKRDGKLRFMDILAWWQAARSLNTKSTTETQKTSK